MSDEYEWKLKVEGRKYDPNQPRVPAGQEGGGRWTSGGVAAPSSREWMDNLTPEEMSAVRDYTWLGSQSINSALRSGEELRSGGPFGDPIGAKETVRMLDKVTRTAPLTTKDAVYYHRMELGHLKRAGRLKPGEVIEEKGFMSLTDKAKGGAFPGRHYTSEGLLELHVPKGSSGVAPIANLSQYPREREWLLGRGRSYRIINVREPDFFDPYGIWIPVIEAELLP